jgi:hypothetical protein
MILVEKMKQNKYEVNIVSGDAEARIVLDASHQRDAILIAAQKIKNNEVNWIGIPNNEWEFLSVFSLGDDD